LLGHGHELATLNLAQLGSCLATASEQCCSFAQGHKWPPAQPALQATGIDRSPTPAPEPPVPLVGGTCCSALSGNGQWRSDVLVPERVVPLQG
jgi:hypothetical protein